jgi:hypothetical protein
MIVSITIPVKEQRHVHGLSQTNAGIVSMIIVHQLAYIMSRICAMI